MLHIVMVITMALSQFAWSQAAQNWTGAGGKGIGITILAPQATGLAEDHSYIPALVQGEFVNNFSTYSAISVLDWEQRDALLVRLISGSYSDSVSAEAAREIGNAIPTTHFMQGNIAKTSTGYNLQMNIIKTADKTTAASFSKQFTFVELDNLTGIRQASLELLQKMGVTLTAKAQEELAGAAAENHVTAQTALARGVTAQRQGTEVAALSYYFKAVASDPLLLEAVNRSSILSANISSGNMGDNVRNEIQWRKQWIDRLTETERFFDNLFKTECMPYTLSYLDTIHQGEINFQNETVTLSIETRLRADESWLFPIERTLRTVLDGLNATGRKNAWQLDLWPRQGVTKDGAFSNTFGVSEQNVFASRGSNFSVFFELVNSQNKVIGKQTFQASAGWGLDRNERPTITASAPERKTVSFQDINVNDITDNLTIRVARVNGADAETAARNQVLQIGAISSRNEKGSFTDLRDKKSYLTIRIGFLTWMAENISYQTDNSGCYGNSAPNCVKYGRLYNWDAAMSACPAGWRLPTDYDWRDLIFAAGGNVAGKKLKSKSGWWDFRTGTSSGTDDLGFSALPGGYREINGRFVDVESHGYWWSATERGGNHADGRMMVHDRSNVTGGSSYPKVSWLSVRCVHDD